MLAQHHLNAAAIHNCEAMCAHSEVGSPGREKLTGGDALSGGKQDSAARPRITATTRALQCHIGSHTDATVYLVPGKKKT